VAAQSFQQVRRNDAFDLLNRVANTLVHLGNNPPLAIDETKV
jgi:hypothetical protein